MPAQLVADLQRALKVQPAAKLPTANIGGPDRFSRDLNVKPVLWVAPQSDHRQTDAVACN
jgi:hypothetical protein